MKINDNGIDRDMSADEIAALKQAQKEFTANKAALAAAADAKAAAVASARAKLAALGLNDDEITAIIGA